MFWNWISWSTAGISSSELLLLNKWIQRPWLGSFLTGPLQAWEIQANTYNLISTPSLTLGGLVHSNPAFLTLTSASHLLLTGWFLSGSMLICASSGASQDCSCSRGYALLPKEKQALTSVEDRPREGRPWRKAAPATPHHHWQAPKCTLHRKSLPSCCLLGHCLSLVVLFHIYSW